ncbi:hypothetical protein BDN72DRAFT_781639, partial [Pluteus cervinus]
MHRIRNGVHENTPLEYQPIGGLVSIIQRKTDVIQRLRFTKLNDSRKLVGKIAALDDHKQWILAVASGRVDRVASLVQAGLARHVGVRTLIREYERAADRLYRPKGYTSDDIQKAIVMLRLGGARIAEFAHLALSLPSITTIRRNSSMQPLTISPAMPTIQEVEANLALYHATDVMEVLEPSGNGVRPKIVHQILMFDEIATEKRPRWDDSTNMICGGCREHSGGLPLEFCSERELDLFCDALDKNKVHLASEATIAAIGLLSANPREYSPRPILISGTCKQETGEQHARLIATVLKAVENDEQYHRTISIASDGESKRGDALVILTMNSELKPESPIYPLLRPLSLLNFLVGKKDITADKDFKHVLKRQRNLMMRNKGFIIQGCCLTPAILHLHLQDNGMSPVRLGSLLNPNDKQDVTLSLNLLKAIWDLPALTATEKSDPTWIRGRQALRLYGQFARHLTMPYICIDLDLSEQLVHLSTALHLALFLFCDNGAGTRFMPSQSYLDIMIMVKNAYFCVAKAKVDNPGSKFFLIQLGTDRLEGFFGLIRTAVGTDCNVDVLQLANRASGLIEVSMILAEHPEWDRTPRRLNLPAISQGGGDLTSKVDHINPASWRGCVDVDSVNLHTCWVLGQQEAIVLIPEAEDVFSTLHQKGWDILQPFGDLLVNKRGLPDDYDCSELASTYPTPSPVSPAGSDDPFTMEGDVEDAIAEEHSRSKTATVRIKGNSTTKPKAL